MIRRIAVPFYCCDTLVVRLTLVWIISVWAPFFWLRVLSCIIMVLILIKLYVASREALFLEIQRMYGN